MKVQDFAYNVCVRTMELLEQEQHYKIPEETRKKISQEILAQLASILEASK